MRYRIRPYSIAHLLMILKDNINAGLVGAALFVGIYFVMCLVGGL